ncbi:MAG: hypothetical protein E7379_02575 [Clostridiales bacterium]|nr:hypothetical protein [Clostridiales bacterium]
MKKLIRYGIASQFFFLDENGNKSELFQSATDYKLGFAIVHKSKNDKSQYRDLLGRLSDKPTSSGICFYNFCLDQVVLEDIPLIHFSDTIFCEGIKKQIVEKLKKKALNEYKSGCTLDKENYAKILNKQFAFIERMHTEALKCEKRQLLKAEKEKQKNLLQEQEQSTKENLRKQSLTETLDYLENV